VARSARPSLAAALLLFFLAAGCRTPESPEHQRDRELLRALDALRDAPAEDLPGRRKLMEALVRQEAGTRAGERARDACAKAYGLLIEVKEQTRSASRALADAGADAGLPAGALLDLSLVTVKLEQAEAAMTDCDVAAGELRGALRRP
jgi:hypothetical protein